MDPMIVLCQILLALGSGIGVGWWLRSKLPTINPLPQRPLDEHLLTLGLWYLTAANAAKQNPNAKSGEEKRLRDASNAFYAAAKATKEPLEIKELKLA